MGIMYSELAQRVRAALAGDPRTHEEGIKVVDNNGILTLRGEVSSEMVRQPHP
jgi:osmotically-inducible protein OsmY